MRGSNPQPSRCKREKKVLKTLDKIPWTSQFVSTFLCANRDKSRDRNSEKYRIDCPMILVNDYFPAEH